MVKVRYGLYKTTRSQHIYLSCHEKGRLRTTSAERVRYIKETRKKSVLEQNLVFPSPVGLNTSAEKRKNLFPESNLSFPSIFCLITSTETREKRVSRMFRSDYVD